MGLFARKPEAAPEAPASAKTRKGVTCGELDTAINAVCAEMADCTTRRTLQALTVLTSDYYGAEGIFELNGPAPVSLTQFDEALADLDNYELPANTLSPLKRVRALLANAEAQEAKASGAPVTRAEFEAAQAANALALVVIADLLHDPSAGSLEVRLNAAMQAVEFKSAAAGIQALLDRIEKARSADGERQRRRESGRLTVAPGGRNF
jgi:hypothetical protein